MTRYAVVLMAYGSPSRVEDVPAYLADIREGTFAQDWIEQMQTGEPKLNELRAQAADERIEEQTRPFGPAIERLDTIPGVGRRSAEQILAELGDDMRRFPTAAQAASWSGICPGNHESAGKRRNGRTRKGNAWLRSTLVESARAAVRNRGCYLSAQYHALARRRGDKKAIVAVGHSILVAAWHILRDGVEYRDLGPDHFDRLNRERLVQYHTRRLAELGLTVQLPGAQATA